MRGLGRRKWIAEQQHAQHQRRSEEVSREYAQEQEFFRQAALVSQNEKEKLSSKPSPGVREAQALVTDPV
ncbi:hypothetical protein V2J09_016108 [Rumex salicifolius]